MELQPGTLFERLFEEAALSFEIHQADVIDRNEPVRLLHYESFSNNIGVNLICFRPADFALLQGRGLERVNDTELKTTINKITNKIVTVVDRRFKTDDEVVIRKGKQMRRQRLEAISVICEFERIEEYFTI